jgi:hypothetical protein
VSSIIISRSAGNCAVTSPINALTRVVFASPCAANDQNIPVIPYRLDETLLLFWRQNPRLDVLIEREHPARPFAHRKRGRRHNGRNLAGKPAPIQRQLALDRRFVPRNRCLQTGCDRPEYRLRSKSRHRADLNWLGMGRMNSMKGSSQRSWSYENISGIAEPRPAPAMCFGLTRIPMPWRQCGTRERRRAQIRKICDSIGCMVTRTVLIGPVPVVPSNSATLTWLRVWTGAGAVGADLLL